MTYSAPSAATFAENFPTFATVGSGPYLLWSARAARVVNPISDCLDEDVDLACMLLTAHYLTLQGHGTGTESQMAAQGATGFTRFKSGSVELERSSEKSGEYAETRFGRQVWPMLKACLAGPRVLGTGTQPSGDVPW